MRTLPPGQRPVHGFPRFGRDLRKPPPAAPADPVIAVLGAVAEEFDLPLDRLSTLPRRELRADFHCVAGWSATDLHWEGVPFAELYRAVVEPALRQGAEVTHVLCHGMDGWTAVLTIEDALADDVLVADHLDGRPLTAKHGAPVRLVSPRQYGYKSVKHLCRVEVLTSAPRRSEPVLFRTHPRGRVWEEERNGTLPTWLVRPLYRAVVAPIRRLRPRRA